MGVDPTIFYLVAGFCVLLVALDKAGFGSGMGVLATPLLILVCDRPTTATGILLPILICVDWVTICFWWRRRDRHNYRILVPGSVLGIVLAALVLWVLLDSYRTDPALQYRHNVILKQIIGAIAVLFVLYQVCRPWLTRRAERFHPRTWHGWLAGFVAGATSTFSHSGGPPVTMFLIPQHLDQQTYVSTCASFFTTTNALKLIPYALLGLLAPANLFLSATLLPIIPLGVALGLSANKRINPVLFARVIMVMLAVIGAGYLCRWF